MQLLIKPFDELTRYELYAILQLRQIVFVVEQDCIYLDIDDKDQSSIHVFYIAELKILAYARVLGPGISYNDFASIGRVVNHPDYRGEGLGKKLMEASIKTCRQHFPNSSIKISAQCYLDGFYKQLGFVDTGDHYLEDGIPHQAMILDHG